MPLARFEENGVVIEVILQRDSATVGRLVATFTPLDPRMHLYSKDLPHSGGRGLGRPTLLEIVSSHELTAGGVLTANHPTIPLSVPTVRAKLPVYPTGPVTLTLPVSIAAVPGDTSWLSVTYMACSDRVCLAPVVDHHIAVVIPAYP